METHGLGFTLALENLSALTADPARWHEFRAELDRRAIACIELAHAPPAAGVLALAQRLGQPSSPAVYGVKTLADCECIGDFSAPAKSDDGRPRKPSFIESLHSDVMQAGWAAYGILNTRQVPEAPPMRWVDMRAVYTSLPALLQARLRDLTGLQQPRPTLAAPRSEAMRHPLVALHPRTQQPLLFLPDRMRGAIAELADHESRSLLRELWSLVEAHPAKWSRPLQSGALYVWDNLATVHDNPAYPRSQARQVWFLNTPQAAPLAPARS